MILERKTLLNVEQILADTQHSLPDTLPTNEVAQLLKQFLTMQQLYNAAIRQISTKFEIFDEEFQILYSRNPIHHIESRLKSPRSIADKLVNRGYNLAVESAKQNITDIAGIRVICNYIEDVYTMADLLLKQDDISIIRISDYIKEPKTNGYRSLHIVASVPVALSTLTERVPVEIQLRTIAMDFWASLEHQLRYKSSSTIHDDLQHQLKDCAESIAEVDKKMQNIYDLLK